MTRSIQSILSLVALLLGAAACGIPISDSAALTFVAPLEGTWTLRTNSDVELRITIPGGQDLYAGDFDFTAEIEDTGMGGSTSYEGSASGQTFELRDPGTNAVVLTGEMVLESASSLMLSDGSMYDKPFDPDFTTGTWQDVNFPTRFYKFDTQDGMAQMAAGCAADTDPDRNEVEGVLTAAYDGENISLFRVADGGVLSVRAPAYFYGASAIRVVRVDGYLHLQRVDRNENCP